MINSFIWRQIPAPMWLIAGAMIGFGCSDVPNDKKDKEAKDKTQSDSVSEAAKVMQSGFSCSSGHYHCTYGIEVQNNHSTLVEMSYKIYFYDDRDVIVDSQESGGVVPANSAAYFGGDFYQEESNQAVRIDIELESQEIEHRKLEKQLEKVGLLGKQASNKGKWFEIRDAKYVFEEDDWSNTSELFWEIHNPFELEITRMTLGVVFYNSAGEIIGGAPIYAIQSLREKSTTRASEYMTKEFPQAASVKISANWGYLLEFEDD